MPYYDKVYHNDNYDDDDTVESEEDKGNEGPEGPDWDDDMTDEKDMIPGSDEETWIKLGNCRVYFNPLF